MEKKGMRTRRGPGLEPDLNRRIVMLLDGDLSRSEAKVLEQQLRDSPSLQAIFYREKSCRDWLRSQLPRRQASESLRNAIQNNIATRSPNYSDRE